MLFLNLVILSRTDELLMQTFLPGSRHISGSYIYLFLSPTSPHPLLLFLPWKWGKLGGFPFFSHLLKTENHYTAAWWKVHQAVLQTQTLFWHKNKGHFIFVFFPGETASSAWEGLPLWTLLGTMGLWAQLDPEQATIKQTIIKQAGRNLCRAALPAYPTPVYSHILRHYFKSRWCSVVEQTSNYPPDTLKGLPTCDCKKLLHPKLRAVVWLFSIIGCNQV